MPQKTFGEKRAAFPPPFLSPTISNHKAFKSCLQILAAGILSNNIFGAQSENQNPSKTDWVQNGQHFPLFCIKKVRIAKPQSLHKFCGNNWRNLVLLGAQNRKIKKPEKKLGEKRAAFPPVLYPKNLKSQSPHKFCANNWRNFAQ